MNWKTMLLAICWNAFVLLIAVYVVFWLHRSAWWFVGALILFDYYSIKKETK
jgi:hypothetical protein